MNIAKPLFAFFVAGFLIGCQDNSVTEPQSATSNHTFSKPFAVSGTHNFARMVRNPSGVSKTSIIEVEGSVQYDYQSAEGGYNLGLTTGGILRSKQADVGSFDAKTNDYIEFAPEQEYIMLSKAYETTIDGEMMMLSLNFIVYRAGIELDEISLNPLE